MDFHFIPFRLRKLRLGEITHLALNRPFFMGISWLTLLEHLGIIDNGLVFAIFIDESLLELFSVFILTGLPSGENVVLIQLVLLSLFFFILLLLVLLPQSHSLFLRIDILMIVLLLIHDVTQRSEFHLAIQFIECRFNWCFLNIRFRLSLLRLLNRRQSL